MQELHEAADADWTDRAEVAARGAFCLGLTLAEAPRGNLSWVRAAMELAYPGYDVTFSPASLPSG